MSLPRRVLTCLFSVLLAAAMLTFLGDSPAGAAATSAATAAERHVIVQFAGSPALASGHNRAAPSTRPPQRARTTVADARRVLVARDDQVLAAIENRVA